MTVRASDQASSNAAQRPLFLGRASLLTAGTVGAQAIGFLSMPFVAILYGPSAYGQFAVVQAIAGALAASTLLRYDMALVQADSERDAASLARVAIWLSCGLILLASLMMLAAWSIVTTTLNLAALGVWWLPLCAASAALGAWSTVATAMLIRHQRAAPVAISRVTQSLAGLSAQLACGLAFAGQPVGLPGGMVVGQIVSTIVLWLAWRKDAVAGVASGGAPRPGIGEHVEIARQFANFPRHAATTVILNTVSAQLLPLAISAFFGPALAGAVALAQRLTQFPLMLVTAQLWQLIFARLRGLEHEARRALLRKVHVAASFGFALPVAVIAVNGEFLIGLLGERWSVVLPGHLTAFCLLGWSNATSNMISYFTVFDRYRAESVINVTLFVVRLLALVIAGTWLMSDQAVYAFAFISTAFYLGLVVYWGQRVIGLWFAVASQAAAFVIATGVSRFAHTIFGSNPYLAASALGVLTFGYYAALALALIHSGRLSSVAAGVRTRLAL